MIIILFTHLACFWMLDALLEYTTTGNIPTVFMDENTKKHKTVKTTSNIENGKLPYRMEGNYFSRYSKVLMTDEPTSNFKSLPSCPSLTYAIPVLINESIAIDHYKPQKLLPVEETISIVNSALQNTDTLWLKRRVGGGASISTLQYFNIDIMAYDVKENQEDNEMTQYGWSYIIVIIIIVIAIGYLLKQWKYVVSKRHSCKKRIVGRIRRVIQTVAVRRIPTQM